MSEKAWNYFILRAALSPIHDADLIKHVKENFPDSIRQVDIVRGLIRTHIAYSERGSDEALLGLLREIKAKLDGVDLTNKEAKKNIEEELKTSGFSFGESLFEND